MSDGNVKRVQGLLDTAELKQALEGAGRYRSARARRPSRDPDQGRRLLAALGRS